jgi:hypothetical protein
MAALIRFPSESDAEYQRRAAPLLAAMADVLRRNNRLMAERTLEDSPILQAMRISELRASCGVKVQETFKWDIQNLPSSPDETTSR